MNVEIFRFTRWRVSGFWVFSFCAHSQTSSGLLVFGYKNRSKNAVLKRTNWLHFPWKAPDAYLISHRYWYPFQKWLKTSTKLPENNFLQKYRLVYCYCHSYWYLVWCAVRNTVFATKHRMFLKFLAIPHDGELLYISSVQIRTDYWN